MLFNGNRFRHNGIFSPSKKVKTCGSTQNSDYYETKTIVA